jgi:hypothetical protein
MPGTPWHKPLLYYPAGGTIGFPEHSVVTGVTGHHTGMVAPVSDVSVLHQLVDAFGNPATRPAR